VILSGKARLAGVLGWPVSHSRSPRLHGCWIERHGLDAAYLPLPVEPERFASAVTALRDLGFRGVNVTIPHKQAAFAICDQLGAAARRTGSVNTLVFESDGIHGDSTDGYGFIENLNAGVPDWPRDRPAAVIGAGGAAAPVIDALVAAGVPEIRLINRTATRADALAEQFGRKLRVCPWGDWDGLIRGAGLVVNATALGMTGQPPLPPVLHAASAQAVVTDLVYAPLVTPLLAEARAAGLRTVDGLGMLLHQARPGFKAWFGVEPAVDQELRDFVLGTP